MANNKDGPDLATLNMRPGHMAPPKMFPMLSAQIEQIKANDPDGTSLTAGREPRHTIFSQKNGGHQNPASAQCRSPGAGHGATKSSFHSNSFDVGQQRTSPLQCLERDVRARSPGKSLAFHGVPEDVYVHFLQYMSVQDLWKVSQVSRTLRRQCQCNSMWRKLCLSDFGDDAPIILERYTDVYAEVQDQNSPGFYQYIYRRMLDFRIEIKFLQGPRANEQEKVTTPLLMPPDPLSTSVPITS
jgi:hypothetical protein